MNSLFIGIGGAGCSAVAEFARKVRNHGSNANNAYLYLDTDSVICENFPFIRNDFISLGEGSRQSGHSIRNIIKVSIEKATNPNVRDVQKRKFVRFLQWYDTNIESNEELTKGAEGIRMMSRAMLFANYTDIKNRIRAKLWYTDPDDGMSKIRKIYVVSGTCGGTGSGCVLDILYMINKISEDQNVDATELPVNLLLVMPQGYINGIPDNSSLYTSYRTNAYAFIDEINAFLKDYYGYYSPTTDENGNLGNFIFDSKAGMKMNDFCCTDEGGGLKFNVFQNAFLFDSVTPDGHDMSHEQRSENVANFLFALEVGKQANAILDTNISNNVRTEKYCSAEEEFIHAFAASGMYVVQTWEELTRKYVREKFLYQMLRDGFLGADSVIPEELLSASISTFGDEIQNILTVAKNEHGSGIKDLLAQVLGGYDYDGLAKIMQDIKDATANKKPAANSVFSNSNSKDTVKALAITLDQVLEKVKDTTCRLCEEWAKRHNLNTALQLVKKLDGAYDRKYKAIQGQIKDFKIESYYIKKADKRRTDCAELFDMYVDFLVYRGLSYENEGFLDDCKRCLDSAIKAIAFNEHKKDGRKVVDWELDFIKYLNDLSTDDTRSVWPSLEGLYNADSSNLIRGNSVETDYSALVSQTETGDGPDLTYDLNREHLLLTYKHKCFEALARRDARWTGYFDMKTGSDTFARNILVAFETFEKEVENQGFDLSNSPSLKKPFTSLTLSAAEQQRLFDTIQGFDHVNLATQYHMQAQQHVGIYVGDFNNLPWLDARLFPNGYNQMEISRAQDVQMSDRIVKLFVEFGYPLDKYRYFRDVYKPFFDEFHNKAKTQPRHHQPYIDKRFFEMGNVHAYFQQTERDEEIKTLNADLKDHKSDFFKFCALFLYKVLKSHENEGFLEEKKLKSAKFFKIKSAKTGKSKKESIVFGMTHDFDTWRDHESYAPSGEEFTIDLGKKYSDSEIKPFANCFDLWSRILQFEKQKTVLDPDRIREAFDETRDKMYDEKNLSLSTFLMRVAEKYSSEDKQGNRIIDWIQLFKDFLTVFPVRKR